MIAMLGIIINHLVYQGNGLGKFPQYKRQLLLLNSLFFWHNDGYILISGVVGYKSNKYSNLLYLWLSTLFYSILIPIYFAKISSHSNKSLNISVEYFPVIFKLYWFFTIYFGMYLFLPVINKGISLLTKVEFKLLIISLIGIFSFWKGVKNPKKDIFMMCNGFSVSWFLCLYLVGAYIGKYNQKYNSIKKLAISFICLFIYGTVTLFYYKIINNQLTLGQGYLKNKIVIILNQILNLNFDSVLKVAQSISICLFFLQINYNQYIRKIFSFFGPLNFGVYLIHMNIVFNYKILIRIFTKDKNNLSLNSTLLLILKKTLTIYFSCIFIEYLRFILFRLIRIKKICILLEAWIYKLLS